MIISYFTMSNSGSFGMSTSREDIGTKNDANDILWNWEAEHCKVGSDKKDAFLWAYKGDVPDCTDMYPDWEVRRGPRGGIVWSPC